MIYICISSLFYFNNTASNFSQSSKMLQNAPKVHQNRSKKCWIRKTEAREFLKGIMAFLDSTGELTDEARAAFMEAMVEEESDEEEEPEVF